MRLEITPVKFVAAICIKLWLRFNIIPMTRDRSMPSQFNQPFLFLSSKSPGTSAKDIQNQSI